MQALFHHHQSLNHNTTLSQSGKKPRPIPERYREPEEDNPAQEPRDLFIQRMKAYPQTWGNIPGKVCHNAISMRRGWIEIYHLDGSFAKSIYFFSHADKLERLKEANKQIKNLPNFYLQIVYMSSTK